MTVYHVLIAALWIVLIVYWSIAAFGAKRTINGRWNWRLQIGLRLGIVALVFLLNQALSSFHNSLDLGAYLVTTNPVMGLIGTALCAIGVGIAIWGRACLGRNWGMPMSQKEHPELVTTGAYARARHPIYGGMLLTMLGSTIGLSIVWLVPLIIFGGYFIYSARREEKMLVAQFPDTYPAYMKKTKMLLPFLL